MANNFYDRTNDATGGAFFDRTNNADSAAAFGTGDIGTVIASAPNATALGYLIVTLVDPIYTGPGSIAFTSNFTGTPTAGNTVRYPTTNGFAVLSDGSVVSDTNTGAYACFYNDGSGEVAFTVNLDGDADVFAALAGAVAGTAPNATAVGNVFGDAQGAGVTVTAVTLDGFAAEAVSADIGTVTTVAPAATASAPDFTADAQGTGANGSAFTVDGFATGAGAGLGLIDAVAAQAPEGTANEAGRADASGELPTVIVADFTGRGRAQWGKVPPSTTIWTRVT